jgi:hypothetical protein
LVASNRCAEAAVVTEEHCACGDLVANATERYRDDGEVTTVIEGNLATGSWAIGASIGGDPAGVATDRRIYGCWARLAHLWHSARGVRCAWVFWADGLNVGAVSRSPFRDDWNTVDILNGWALHA